MSQTSVPGGGPDRHVSMVQGRLAAAKCAWSLPSPRAWKVTVHRSRLITELAAYAARFPGEAATVERFREFVGSHGDCFERTCLPGHVTASAWIVDPHRARVLLTLHRKLGRWLQPGGHSDGDADSLAVALREAREESGLDLVAHATRPIDIDIHEIPARGGEPAHLHYDLRYALEARSETFTVSEESHDLAWVALDALEAFTTEESVLRMQRKWLDLAATPADAGPASGG